MKIAKLDEKNTSTLSVFMKPDCFLHLKFHEDPGDCISVLSQVPVTVAGVQ